MKQNSTVNELFLYEQKKFVKLKQGTKGTNTDHGR